MIAIERWRPFGSVTKWDSEMNRLFDSFFGKPVATSNGERMWAPALDMYETKDGIVLNFELPGVREKDVTLSIMDDVLTLKGERAFDRDVKDEGYHHTERVYGKFERSIQLPAGVQAEKVQATYRDGMLEVKLPKAEEVKPREIKINIA
jgi:HSP20 family protein